MTGQTYFAISALEANALNSTDRGSVLLLGGNAATLAAGDFLF